MSTKLINIIIFILSLVALIISANIFINISIFSNETKTSLPIIYGSTFWFYMNWARLGFLSVICVLTGVNIFNKMQNSN
ncbi:Uncharacterised protein [[Clostridium] sordellii]|uniref:Uncharacterized protein n=1 Tax=Paraclostridium sordellii TaxID=1505 RepID=A0A0A8VYT0_PARSO|nr:MULTISPECIES: hypothetical protein [Paeniclostridium]AUN13528.1 hypothetical protein RSJ16_04550 [Paeniclostridium sordellii]EPZ58122.1 putative membrane protein [[Clostridium] sordellii VPI 9048] [Paeniclostridium sordellii VPI 9048]MBS6024232.1 hypothetical protein [Paeniclostridium sordellii]MBW4863729.1 hypothetical protein [Paeniclostridium sp.]MBX9180481.1 hypothetical protein [Paeniclostridium sordellii]